MGVDGEGVGGEAGDERENGRGRERKGHHSLALCSSHTHNHTNEEISYIWCETR